MSGYEARPPELIPMLSRGKHRGPRKGACFMELASYLAGERWSDHPGVCGGFAAYSGIDANIVRLVMVLLAVLGGPGLVLYLVAWLIVPEEDAAEATGHGGQ